MNPSPGERGRAPSRAKWLTTVIVGLLCAAPVPGDIGSCGQPVQLLDAPRFFESKQLIDCRRCRSCNLETTYCDKACKDDKPPIIAFSDGCEPLVHDGEVCLRELLYASCDDYAGFVSDDAPTVPTECNFCPGKAP